MCDCLLGRLYQTNSTYALRGLSHLDTGPPYSESLPVHPINQASLVQDDTYLISRVQLSGRKIVSYPDVVQSGFEQVK
jgi:hypothetical protein